MHRKTEHDCCILTTQPILARVVMKRRLIAKLPLLLLALLTVNTLITVTMIKLVPANLQINLRYALFSKKAPTHLVEKLNATDDLSFTGFKNPIRKYYSGKLNQILNPSFDHARNALDSARQIALALSNQPAKGHNHDQSDDLLQCVTMVSQGFGRCSDYAQSFAAACLENNIMVREVSNMTHTFNEIYIASLGKWIFIDAQNCLTAQDAYGNLLSALDIFNAYACHKPFKFVSFAPCQKFIAMQRDSNRFYEVNGNSDAYQYLVITNGINVFQVNKWNRDFHTIPKAVRQFALLSIGVQPGYLVYDPNNHIRPSLIIYRIVFVLALVLIGLINLAMLRLPILQTTVTWVKRGAIKMVPEPSYVSA